MYGKSAHYLRSEMIPLFFTAVGEPPFGVSGQAARQPYIHPNDDFFQAGELYRRVMTDEDRDRLIGK